MPNRMPSAARNAALLAGVCTVALALPARAQAPTESTPTTTEPTADQPASATPPPTAADQPSPEPRSGQPTPDQPAPGGPGTPSPVPAPSPDQATADEVGLEEIVVTAQKRAENLQDVPISIAAVSGQAVEDLRAVTLQNLQGTVPNVQINNFSNTPQTAVFTIRGIGVIEPDPYAGNTVSIVVDGVPQYFSMGALLDLYDIDRIEILRGPQGTLFGANTTGGVVNVVTAQPTGEFGGKAEFGYGNWSHANFAGTIDFPIVQDLLAGKITVSHDDRKGWVRNIWNGDDMGRRNVTIFRGYLKATPTDNFDATLIGEYDRARNGAPIVVAGDVPGEAQFVPAGTLIAGSREPMYQSPCLPGERCRAPDKYRSANNSVPDRSDMDTYRGTLTMNLSDTVIGDITSITGYKHFELFEFTDQDGTPIFLDDTRRRTEGWQFSQELRTSVDLTDSINVLVGGFYLKTHYDHVQDFRIDFSGGFTVDPVTGEVTKGLRGLFQRNLQDQDNWSLSGFAQAYWDVTEQLRLQAGVRYSYEKTSMLASTATSLALGGVSTFEGTAPDGTPNVPIPAAGAFPPPTSENWNNVGWKVGADYKINDDVLLYAYWARGFKSGGFTGRIGIPQDIGPYDPEKVDTYEVGVKADLLDRRLRTNAAAFYTDYRDMQLSQIYFLGSGENLVQGNTIVNAASSRIWGTELEVEAVPIEALTLSGSVAYLNAEYKNFPFQLPDRSILQLKGERLQNAPKWTASANATYEFPIATGTGRINLNYSYTSEKLLTSIIDTPRATIRPVSYVNGNVDWQPIEGLTLSVWSRNLFDKRHVASVFDAPGTIGLVNYAPPREYGVSAKVIF